MGQNLSTTNIKNYTARIETNDEKIFKITYHSLVEHILLLRQVISHPQLTEDGPVLEKFIQKYCQRMAQGQMQTIEQQEKLSWEIEWIWHVHRLRPLHYLNDCNKQLPNGLIDKKRTQITAKPKKRILSKTVFPSQNTNLLFVPSIDLKSAAIRQADFLKKFQNHFLYDYNLEEFNELKFQNLVQNYVSFVKLAKNKQMIVPTFDIDLIWHTHMRYPSHYHEFTKVLCGFILDHDDAIESSVLANAYQKTADQWRQTYLTEYGQNVDREYLMKSHYQAKCAMVFAPIFLSDTSTKRIHPAWMIGCATSTDYEHDTTLNCATAGGGEGQVTCDDTVECGDSYGGGGDGGGCSTSCGGGGDD